MVMEGLQEDMGEGSMVCTNHPYKNNSPGGICATCLQEKLGKLVSSSFPVAVFPSQSSSSSPSFRSEFGNVTSSKLSTHNKTASSSSSSNAHHVNEARNSSNNIEYQYHHHQYYSRRPRIMYLLSQKKKKKKDLGMMCSSDQNNTVFKRSKSTTTPRRGMHFMDTDDRDDLSHQKRGFWSFLYLQKQSAANRKTLRDISSNSLASSNIGSVSHQRNHENETPDNEPASFDRKVSRSRSVGCGSRSFSGDFFERISTGFGDCTLRRVESQREGKSKVAAVRGAAGAGGHDCIKDRVKCGGIFSGFMIASSSSSSSSSSYWVSSSTEENNPTNAAGKMPSAPLSSRQLAHSRSKSWGWALASPMRAFTKPSSSGKRETSNKNVTPNLSAIPSLLAVRS